MKIVSLISQTFLICCIALLFFLTYKNINNNYIWKGNLFGFFDLFLLSGASGWLWVFLAKHHIWREVGFIIADKKYNKGHHDHVHYEGEGCPCCSNPHNNHIGSFAYYGPFTVSRIFVRKFICEYF